MVSLPAPPLEDVVAGVAGERVGERVAGGVDGARAGQGQVLDIGAERVADAALHGVGALAGGLGDHVAGGIDHIVSLPAPPIMVSLPAPPIERYRCPHPFSVSLPARPRWCLLRCAGQHIVPGRSRRMMPDLVGDGDAE